MTTKRIIRIDSTALGRAGCILHLYRHVVDGYRTKGMDASMVYGIAIHKFIQGMYESKDQQGFPQAMKTAEELFLSLPAIPPEDRKMWLRDVRHFRSVAFMFWQDYITEDKTFEVIQLPNGKPASELTFSYLIFEDENCQIFLQGTIDNLGKFFNGCNAIRDFKTTSSWDTKGYFSQYKLSRQLRVYRLACKIASEREPESVLGKIGATKMGTFIDALFLKPKPNECTFGRSDVYQYEEDDIAAFSITIDDLCKRIAQAIATGYLPKEGILNGSCVSDLYGGKYKQCSFWNVCAANKMVAELMLRQQFEQKEFEPLMYNQ